MSDLNTVLEEIKKGLNKAVDTIGENVKDLHGVVQIEKKKLEIKAQIGQHQRAITKAYVRIGEAYVNEEDMQNVQDVIELVKSNQKLIDLLNEQLETLRNKG